MASVSMKTKEEALLDRLMDDYYEAERNGDSDQMQYIDWYVTTKLGISMGW